MSSLYVNVEGRKSGKLSIENGEVIFSYSSEEREDYISLTMPVRQKSYIHSQLHPFFEMHLPEGYLLSIIKKHFSKFHKTDDFGLLQLMASSIKGRVTFRAERETERDYFTLDNLLHSKDENLFEELVSRFALRSSLSGVQPKVLAEIQDRATLKLEGYIVKSWGEEYPQLALNEYYCMRVVEDAKVKVPEFYISDDEKLFIMKRFDIVDGRVFGFEDMCVLQAKQRDDKYEGSYEQVAKSIKTFVSARYKKEALIQLFKMIVINNMVQNGDAHLKNFGLVYEDIEHIDIAPAYDVVSTTVYIERDIPALHLLGSKKWFSKKLLLKFGRESCDLTPKEAEKYYDDCSLSLEKNIRLIEDRLSIESDSSKRELLIKLLEKFTYMSSRDDA